MTFALTLAHVTALIDPAVEGNFVPFLSALDPAVRWLIGSETKDPSRLTGVYNVASWLEEVSTPLRASLTSDGVKINLLSLEVVGNKAIMELCGEATQLNGRPYNNRYAWFLIFSEETGKIVEIREYLDTALVQETIQTNAH